MVRNNGLIGKVNAIQVYLTTVPTAVMSKLKSFIPMMLLLTVKVKVTATLLPALTV